MGLSAKEATISCYLHSLAMRVNQIMQVSIFGGEPSSGNRCLDYDTIHHFPSAEFQRVMVESLSLALGPQQRIERGGSHLLEPAGKGWEPAGWDHLPIPQLCVSSIDIRLSNQRLFIAFF